MGTISTAFNITRGALEADQSALNIVANNVANASTTGYTREIPNWQENPPAVINGTVNGTGVTETGPTSVRDRVLTERLDQQQQLASASGSRLSALDTLQALFTPDSGSKSGKAGDIGSDITGFFSSLSTLEGEPTNGAYRQAVLSSATTLASDVSNAAASLNAQSSALDQEAGGVTSQVNALTSALAQINQQITTTSPSADAGTLEDQRQQDLSKLSQLVGINQITTENNGLTITTTSGELLVAGNTSMQMTSGSVDGTTHFFVGTVDATADLATGGGSLGGYLTARDQDIPAVLSSLNQLAYSVSTSVNALNNAGTNLAGETGTTSAPINIFSQPSSVTGAAASMSVVMTDPNQIAAAAKGAGVGNNTNATAMAALQNQGIVNGQTPSNFYSSLVSNLGSTVSQVQTNNTALTASVSQLQTQINQLSEVNLNDEASNMQMFERSYQAASQVFAILNTVIGSALNLGISTAVS